MPDPGVGMDVTSKRQTVVVTTIGEVAAVILTPVPPLISYLLKSLCGRLEGKKWAKHLQLGSL